MTNIIDVRQFHQPLMKAGIVPPNCRLLAIQIGTTGPMTVTYEVLLTAEQLGQLGVIFQTVGDVLTVARTSTAKAPPTEEPKQP